MKNIPVILVYKSGNYICVHPSNNITNKNCLDKVHLK